MLVYIHYNGVDYNIDKESSDVISSIKIQIASELANVETGDTVQVPTQYQHLMYDFAELVDANTLSSSNIQKDGRIYLVIDIAGFSQPALITFLDTLRASFTPVQSASAGAALLNTDFIMLGTTNKAHAARGLLTQIHILDTLIPLAATNPINRSTLMLNRTAAVNALIALLNTTDGPQVSCFLASAPVLTPTGYVKIATLKEGDHVMTGDGRPVAIQRVKKLRVAAGPYVNPYIFPKGVYGATKRLLISPNHKIDTGAGMHQAKTLGLQQEAMSGYFEY